MRTRIAAAAVAGVAVLTCTSPLRAHHTGTMYATASIWIEGTIVAFESRNPHSVALLEARDSDGQVMRWSIEGPARFQLEGPRVPDYLPTVGDTIKVCAFPYRSREELARLFPEADFSGRRLSTRGDDGSPPYVAGHVLVRPDGQRTLWEPHGLLGECIRSSGEPRQQWLDFLDSSASGRDAWCQQRGYMVVRSTPALQEIVEDVDAALEEPCR